MNPVAVKNVPIGKEAPLALIAGPCVLETETGAMEIARTLKDITGRLGIGFVFKGSCDKANRTSIDSYRGPGMNEGLAMLQRIGTRLDIPVTSDVHQPADAEAAAAALDLLQIPAFLCRQTDLVVRLAETGKPLNIKKGQFLAPWDMANVVKKATSTGNSRILLTERGTTFGYNNLVVDMRSFAIMQRTGCPVVFDATHSVQLPGGAGASSSGQREFAGILAGSAMAAGADALFIETHPDPDRALCDGPNSVPLSEMEALLRRILAIRSAARTEG